jgi:hypothetical protein
MSGPEPDQPAERNLNLKNFAANPVEARSMERLRRIFLFGVKGSTPPQNKHQRHQHKRDCSPHSLELEVG